MKKKRNSVILVLVMMTLCVFIFSSCDKEESPFTSEEAIAIASEEVPESAELFDDREEENKFEILFTDSDADMKYKVKVNKFTETVSKIEGESTKFSFGNSVNISEDDAEKIILKHFPDAHNVIITLEHDDNMYVYDVEFTYEDGYGDFELNADNGEIVEFSIHKENNVTVPSDSSADKAITSEQASEIALNKAGGGVVAEIELDHKGETYYYEVEILKDGMEYDYVVDAVTGEITSEKEFEQFFDKIFSKPVTNTDDNLITAEEAKAIAIDNAPGSIVTDCELDREPGKAVYEIQTTDNQFEYEFEINARDGSVISFEKEIID